MIQPEDQRILEILRYSAIEYTRKLEQGSNVQNSIITRNRAIIADFLNAIEQDCGLYGLRLVTGPPATLPASETRACPECGSALAVAYFNRVTARVTIACTRAECIWHWSNWREETPTTRDTARFPMVCRETLDTWGVWYESGKPFRTFQSEEAAEEYLKANPTQWSRHSLASDPY